MASLGLPPPLMVPRESLRPPSADSPRAGLAMSALAHAGLLAALALGVQWRTEEPAAVSAELWAAVPQIAAPARPEPAETPEPTPPPRPVVTPPAPPPAAEREADIAIEKARRLREEKARQDAEDQRRKEREQKAQQDKAQQEKAERDKAEKLEAQRKEKAAEAQREKLRQEQMRRMAEQLGGGPTGTGAPGSTGAAARDAGPSANYAGRIVARIKPNIVLTEEVAGNPRAEVELRVGPDGSIVGRRIIQSSGSKVWDDAVLRAVDRTGVLPRDTDGRVPPTIVVGFRPRD
ncbi:cell envelope integrity protein TolA [Ideonella alba]|uniref:cell envelope integrity protein TolA n=1 Tax=Ideonella alba TaxID=2824118 RepID=UPI001FFC4123|nr:cell envelope integrity protein TolA [Ideonella alba]